MSFDQAGRAFIHKGIQSGGRIGGLGGAVAGGVIGAAPSKHTDAQGNVHHHSIGGRIARGAIGAGIGAYTGHSVGRVGGAITNAHRWNKGTRPGITRPDWLKNAKTKAEAKAAFREQAKKTHPDHGGNADSFRNMQKEWEQHEPTFKVAMLAAFQDELEKIAGIGALLGGLAGYKVGPNTTKGKIVGTLVGAGLGHAIGQAGKAAKQGLVDEQHEREMRELYGYQQQAPDQFSY